MVRDGIVGREPRNFEEADAPCVGLSERDYAGMAPLRVVTRRTGTLDVRRT